ncbi:MAG: hypothetical protein ACRD3W_30345, partial [Terriglobales bacterium]
LVVASDGESYTLADAIATTLPDVRLLSTYTKSFSMSLNIAPLKSGSGTSTGNVTFLIDGSPVGTVPPVRTRRGFLKVSPATFRCRTIRAK